MKRLDKLNYYKENHKKIFDSIENPQWRIFKSFDEDGICRQNKRQITSPKKLLKFILQCKNPQKLYVSISTFLSPQSNHGNFTNQKVTLKDGHYFYPHSGFLIADNILIESDFFIDIDDKDIELAKQDTIKILNYMKENKEYELKLCQFSGSNGFHLIYKDKLRKEIPDPAKRIEYIAGRKDKLAQKIVKLGLKTIDKNHLNIMKDIYRVRAATHSIKPSGNIVKPFDTFSVKNLTRAIKQMKIASEGKPVEKQGSNYQYRGNEGASITSCPIHFKFVDNMVNGLNNNFVTVIKKHIKRFNVNKLKEIQKLYRLSDFYIVNIGNYIYAYNPKLVQFKRLMKILRKAKSENISFFYTRRHLPIQISNSVYQDGKSANKIQYVGTLKSKYGLNDFHSKPHCDLFGLNFRNMTGKKNNTGVMVVN